MMRAIDSSNNRPNRLRFELENVFKVWSGRPGSMVDVRAGHAEVNVNLSAKTMLISDYLCESLDKSPKRRQPAAPRPASRPSSEQRARG